MTKGIQMRRLIFLICAVVLLLDLADDGQIGKIRFVPPNHAASYSATSSAPSLTKVDSPVGLLSLNCQDLHLQSLCQPAVLKGISCSNKFIFSFLSSSGGLPL